MIILASKSPRREELMKEYLTSSFLIEPSYIDESIYISDNPITTSQLTAKAKGELIYSKHPNDVIISADTIVVIGNRILGKPKDVEDAINMLSSLGGKTHEVITSYFIISKDHKVLKSEVSTVTFKNVDRTIIEEYVKVSPPLDKAGSYGIQDPYFKEHILDKYKGSLTNIIGLPIEKIIDILQDFSIIS